MRIEFRQPSRHAAALTLWAALLLLALALPSAANPKYAGIVIDANTGKTLYSENADAPRYPASLTKMMTLYLVFEALDSKRITKKTPVPFSAAAASRPPSKLGVGAGRSIPVEAAILALVTKSANDVASALAELLGGSEAKFAQKMTAKARQLGMKNTRFRNASGLPDPQQVTTARDMAILGIALREHFPHHYHYFSTRSFKFGKATFANHNRLLGKVTGVDGIKTGYIHASGFNLVTSVNHNGRKLVAVVMGGRTGASRNAQMTELIKRYLPKASTRSGGPLVASRKVLQMEEAPVSRETAPMALAALAPVVPQPRPVDEAISELITASTRDDVAETESGIAEGSTAAEIAPVDLPTGWAVQVASVPTAEDAQKVLASTQQVAGPVLAGLSGFTELFEKDGTIYHRVRFGVFEDQRRAVQTCASLKKQRISCYAVAR